MDFDGLFIDASGFFVDGVEIGGGASITPQTEPTAASENNTVTETFDNVEVKAIVDGLGAKINEVIAALVAAGVFTE